MRNAALAFSVIALVVVAVIAGYSIFAIITPTPLPTSSSATNQSIVTPVLPAVYVNNQKVTQALCFSIPTRSQNWNVTANYPWTTGNTNTYPPPIRVDYSFAPFPLSGTIPGWLHVSIQPSYITLSDGQNSTATLHLALDSSYPEETANFALHANYTDPLSGSRVMDVIVLGLVVNGTSTDLYGCSHPAL